MDGSSAQTRSPVRVALIGFSGLLGDIIGQSVASEPDFEIVADLASTDNPDEALEVARADILLWNDADESELAQWLDAVSTRCGPRVLATLGDGRNASLWEITPRRTELGSLSPQTLIETIRSSAGRGVTP